MRKRSDFVTPKIGARHFQENTSAQKFYDRENGYRKRANELINNPQFLQPSQRKVYSRYANPQRTNSRYSHHQHTGIFTPDPPLISSKSPSTVHHYNFQPESRRLSSSPEINQPHFSNSRTHSFNPYESPPHKSPQRRASFASENNEQEKIQKLQKSQEQARYREILEQQIREKKEREERERRAREIEDMKKEEEMRNYNPFGKGGGGAPLRKHEGKVYFAGAQVDDIPTQQARFPPNKRNSHQPPLSVVGSHKPSDPLMPQTQQRKKPSNTSHGQAGQPIAQNVSPQSQQFNNQNSSNEMHEQTPNKLSPQQKQQQHRSPYHVEAQNENPVASRSLDKMEQQFQEFRSEFKRYQDFNMMRAFEPFQGLGDAIRDLKYQLKNNQNNNNNNGLPSQAPSLPNSSQNDQLTQEIRHLEDQMKELFEQIRKVQEHEKEQEQKSNFEIEEKQKKEIEKMYEGKVKHLEELVQQVSSAADRIKEERKQEENKKSVSQVANQNPQDSVPINKESMIPDKQSVPLSKEEIPLNQHGTKSPNLYIFNENDEEMYRPRKKKIRIYKDVEPRGGHKKQKPTHSLFRNIEQKNKERMGYWDFIEKNLDKEDDVDQLDELYKSQQARTAWLPRNSSEKELAGDSAWEYIQS